MILSSESRKYEQLSNASTYRCISLLLQILYPNIDEKPETICKSDKTESHSLRSINT